MDVVKNCHHPDDESLVISWLHFHMVEVLASYKFFPTHLQSIYHVLDINHPNA